MPTIAKCMPACVNFFNADVTQFCHVILNLSVDLEIFYAKSMQDTRTCLASTYDEDVIVVGGQVFLITAMHKVPPMC